MSIPFLLFVACPGLCALVAVTNLANLRFVSQATRPEHVQIADIIMFCNNQSGPRDVARVGANLGRK